MSDRVLALSMRPKYFDELVGQDEIKKSLSNQFKSGRIPHLFIITGPIGCGKTTISRILALYLQVRCESLNELTEEHWKDYKKFDIHEINAANKNGVDDIRNIIEMMNYKPFLPSKAKIVILDEAHQLTTAAQNALITETEDVNDHVFYIFCTSAVNKIIPAIIRRAFIIKPQLLDEESINVLVDKAKIYAKFEGDTKDLIQYLLMNDIRSSGLVLQAAEKYFTGDNSINEIGSSSKIDTLEVCRTIVNGNWSKCATLLKESTKTDVFMLKNCILGYLRTVLLKSTGLKAQKIAKAIHIITSHSSEDCLPSLLASICLSCEHLSLAK